MKTSADYFRNSSGFNLVREMDKLANFLEYGVLHSSIEKSSRFMIKINPLKSGEEKEMFLERSDSQLEYLREMSKKSGSNYRKQIAEDFEAALKSIFSGISVDEDLDKLFTVEKVKRSNIKKLTTVEDFYTHQVVINLPNFYATNRNKDYNLESMNLFGERFITLVEFILGTKFAETEKSKIAKQYVIASIESFDDRKTLAKFEYILDGIMDRQREIKLALADMFNALYLAQAQETSMEELAFAS